MAFEAGIVSTLLAADLHADMILVTGSAFRMGSDRHYTEEAPAPTA
jgi:formylglycine-generating enzyme required for sulfatase activity